MPSRLDGRRWPRTGPALPLEHEPREDGHDAVREAGAPTPGRDAGSRARRWGRGRSGGPRARGARPGSRPRTGGARGPAARGVSLGKGGMHGARRWAAHLTCQARAVPPSGEVSLLRRSPPGNLRARARRIDDLVVEAITGVLAVFAAGRRSRMYSRKDAGPYLITVAIVGAIAVVFAGLGAGAGGPRWRAWSTPPADGRRREGQRPRRREPRGPAHLRGARQAGRRAPQGPRRARRQARRDRPSTSASSRRSRASRGQRADPGDRSRRDHAPHPGAHDRDQRDRRTPRDAHPERRGVVELDPRR